MNQFVLGLLFFLDLEWFLSKFYFKAQNCYLHVKTVLIRPENVVLNTFRVLVKIIETIKVCPPPNITPVTLDCKKGPKSLPKAS